MRVMALDIGEVRTGIAISDPDAKVASPLKILPTAEVTGVCKSFKTLLDDYEPAVLLVGLPLSLDGGENAQAQQVRSVAADIQTATGLPLDFVDERFSSSEAKRILREQGCTERTMRGKIDMIAASLFLQAWLDTNE
jgi:putative Holliday junction resolvase